MLDYVRVINFRIILLLLLLLYGFHSKQRNAQ